MLKGDIGKPLCIVISIIILVFLVDEEFFVCESPTNQLILLIETATNTSSSQQYPTSNLNITLQSKQTKTTSPTPCPQTSTNISSLPKYPKHPIHTLHPFKQFEYYKKWYSERKKHTCQTNSNDNSMLIFNPYPAIPKLESRLDKLYNISTRKLQFQAEYSSYLPESDTNRTLPPRKSSKYLLRLKNRKNSVVCDFNGKVFGIGMFKTGTSSLSSALNTLGYHSYYTTKYWVPHKWYRNIVDLYLLAADDISWMFYQPDVIHRILAFSDRSYNFGDGPWLFAYHVFDQYYSVGGSMKGIGSEFSYTYGNLINMENGAKFILTVRNTTWDVVNSNLKMDVRYYKKAPERLSS